MRVWQKRKRLYYRELEHDLSKPLHVSMEQPPVWVLGSEPGTVRAEPGPRKRIVIEGEAGRVAPLEQAIISLLK